MLANGPFREQSDESLRGLCVMAVGVDAVSELMQTTRRWPLVD